MDRVELVRSRLEPFLEAYQRAGIRPTLVFADWELDGPLEINGAQHHARRCVRCRGQIPGIEDFRVFRDTIRRLRCQLTSRCFSEPILRRFPDALVGNYGVYRHDGYRYWYDWFERHEAGQPGIWEQNAFYREWYQEFPLTGYTMGMPVVYTRARIHSWFDFEDPDYRWFYGMMKCVNNAGQHRGSGAPNLSFVHWHTTDSQNETEAPQMSTRAYQELLRHMMLRGTNGLFIWCRPEETEEEIRLVHQVYREIQRFSDWVDRGSPVIFSNSSFSAARLEDTYLVRRAPFPESDTRVPPELSSVIESALPHQEWHVIQA
jgi:hypothetical protein